MYVATTTLMVTRRYTTNTLLSLLLLCTTCNASSGDVSHAFQSCLTNCTTKHCLPASPDPYTPPFPLRITLWTCKDDCAYTCTHSITESHIIDMEKQTPGARIHQYYGKWPFWRVWGIQEPASVVFSLMNMWAHVRGGRRVFKKVKPGHPMRKFYLGMSMININAWIWSAVFHTRGMPFQFLTLFES